MKLTPQSAVGLTRVLIFSFPSILNSVEEYREQENVGVVTNVYPERTTLVQAYDTGIDKTGAEKERRNSNKVEVSIVEVGV